jgi:hypothetical protein
MEIDFTAIEMASGDWQNSFAWMENKFSAMNSCRHHRLLPCSVEPDEDVQSKCGVWPSSATAIIGSRAALGLF